MKREAQRRSFRCPSHCRRTFPAQRIGQSRHADGALADPALRTGSKVAAFTDGTLVTIAPHTAVPTQDGLAVGDDVGKAGQLYGSAVPVTASGRTYAIFAATEGGEVGYDVTFTPDAANAGQLSGPVRSIAMCRCKPAQSAASAVMLTPF